MTTLILVVSLLDQCKQGVCFPESVSVWPRDQLIKVLNLSGIALLPPHYGYEKIIQIFLDHLNAQSPKVYALCTEKDIVLDSTDVKIKNNLLYVGPFAKLQPIATEDCRQIWSIFLKYVHVQRDVRPPESRAVLEKQMRINELEREIDKLKKQMKQSESGRIKVEFDEANKVIRSLESQLREERKNMTQLKEKNLALAREDQVLQARIMELNTQLQAVRTKLSIKSTSPEALEAVLSEIESIKKQLAECQRR